MLPSWHYYEAHVTIDPVFDDRLEEFGRLCQEQGFRVAELLMKKRKQDTEQRSSKDSFCTGTDHSLEDLQDRMVRLLHSLRSHNFTVRRYKIESTVLDSRYEATLFPIANLG
jgi:hypothetical protein